MGHSISIMQGSSQINRLEVGGFRVTTAVYPSRLRLPSHYHEAACFAVVLRGAVDKVFPRHAYELPTASVVTMPPQERHCDQFAPVGAHMLVIEPIYVSEDILRPCAPLFDGIYFARDETAAAISKRISRELQLPDALTSLTVHGLLFELLAMSVRRRRPCSAQSSPPPFWLTTIHDYLNSCFRKSIDLTDLANLVSVHPVHLSRTFRRHYGTTFGEYTRRLRVDWARQQLAISDDSLAHLAQAAGFADQSHFTRVFKRLVGVTPSQYRKSVRQE